MVYTISPANVDGRGPEKDGDQGKAWKQWLLTCIVTLPFFTSALQQTYIQSIQRDVHPYWIRTSCLIASIVCAPFLCWVSDRVGRRAVLLSVTVVQIITCIPLFYDINEATTIASSAITGISLAGIYTTGPIYVLEISSQKTKGISVTSLLIMTSLGELVMKILLMVEEVMILYVVIGLLIIQLLMTMILVETPSFFVKKGRIEKATEALANLKRLPSDAQWVKDSIKELSKESDRAKAGGDLSIISMVRNQIFRAALKIGLALQTVTVLGGRLVFLDHSRVLEQSGVVLEKTWAVGLLIAMVGGAVISMIWVDLWERKYLLASSYAVSAVSLGILAVFTQTDLKAPDLPWVPQTCLLVVVLGYGVGCGLVVLLGCEVFNFEIRSTLVGLIFTYAKILDLAHLQSFQYLEENVGIHCLIYIFAIVNLAGVVYSLFAIPDCKNKTVRQIERQLKRVPIL